MQIATLSPPRLSGHFSARRVWQCNLTVVWPLFSCDGVSESDFSWNSGKGAWGNQNSGRPSSGEIRGKMGTRLKI